MRLVAENCRNLVELGNLSETLAAGRRLRPHVHTISNFNQQNLDWELLGLVLGAVRQPFGQTTASEPADLGKLRSSRARKLA